jgi:hypothetical protein
LGNTNDHNGKLGEKPAMKDATAVGDVYSIIVEGQNLMLVFC